MPGQLRGADGGVEEQQRKIEQKCSMNPHFPANEASSAESGVFFCLCSLTRRCQVEMRL